MYSFSRPKTTRCHLAITHHTNEMLLKYKPAFMNLKKTFKGDLILPDHPEYTKAIARWCHTAERFAGLVAFVRDEEDVALVIRFTVSEKMEIAVKGELR